MSAGIAPAAYGVRLLGLPPTPWLRLTGASDWPAIQVEWDDLDSSGPRLALDTDQGRAIVRKGTPVDEIVHPLGQTVGLQMAMLRGFDAVHAGAVVGRDGAWAVAGTKTAGKSTLLAACAKRGVPVVADDALVLSGLSCFAGPRCIDLRPPSAARLGAGQAVRSATPRRRVTLPPIEGRHSLAGIVHLAWGPGPALERLSSSDSLARLLERHSEDCFPRDPVGLMELAGLPSYELVRPRDWACLDETVSLLERAVVGASAQAAA